MRMLGLPAVQVGDGIGVVVAVEVGVRVGVAVSPGVPMAPGQKPLCKLSVPPDCAPVAAWPMVPARLREPPVEVPPPPAIAFHERLKLPPTWANTQAAGA